MRGSLQTTCCPLPAQSKQAGKERRRERRLETAARMSAVPGAHHAADQEGFALAEGIFYGRHLPVFIPPNGFTGGGLVGLHEDAAPDRAAADVQPQIAQQVGGKFDVAFFGAKEFIQAVVGLDGADVPAVAKVGRAAFGDQFAAFRDPGA